MKSLKKLAVSKRCLKPSPSDLQHHVFFGSCELTRVVKTVYRVFRILSHKASVSCTKKHRVRYRVSTVKNQVHESSFRK